MDQFPAFLIFAGLLGLIAYWSWCRQQAGGSAASQSWTTPYYLRANTPQFSGSQAILPLIPYGGWSLPTYTSEADYGFGS